MKRTVINDDGVYNIIRKQGEDVTIFLERLSGKETKRQLRHWKNLARNSGSNVYFEAVAVPPELQPKKDAA